MRLFSDAYKLTFLFNSCSYAGYTCSDLHSLVLVMTFFLNILMIFAEIIGINLNYLQNKDKSIFPKRMNSTEQNN